MNCCKERCVEPIYHILHNALHNVMAATLRTAYWVRVSRPWLDFISACLWIIVHLIFMADHLMIILCDIFGGVHTSLGAL